MKREAGDDVDEEVVEVDYAEEGEADRNVAAQRSPAGAAMSPSSPPERRVRTRWDDAAGAASSACAPLHSQPPVAAAAPTAPPNTSACAPAPFVHPSYPRVVRSGRASATICIDAHKGQDHFLAAEDFKVNSDAEQFAQGIFAVCDGHGDSRVAAEWTALYIQETLRTKLATMSQSEKSGVTMLKCLRDTVSSSCPAFKSIFPQAWVDCGCTVCLLCVLPETLCVANVGDSRAILVRHGAPFQLTRDQKPEAEQARVEKCGGYVSTGRAGVARVGGVLAMSRAIGDGELKDRGVISEPECIQVLLEEGDTHALIASDGLFDSLSNEEVAKTVAASSGPLEACERLAAQVLARERWPDDITITCVELAHYRAGSV